MARRRGETGALPSKAALAEFINETPGKVGKREIMRAFNLGGSDRVALKHLMNELADDGLVARRRAQQPAKKPVLVVEIATVDHDGDLLGRPIVEGSDELLRVLVGRQERPAPGVGDRFLVRRVGKRDGMDETRVIKRLPRAAATALGIFQNLPGGGRIMPVDRRNREELTVRPENRGDAQSGDLVQVDVLPARRLGLREAKVTEVLGSADAPRAASLIAVHMHDIPDGFPPDVLAEAVDAKPARLTGYREDLREVPFVTIDGADARDFDDAVHAVALEAGGFELTVAIADVAYYVRPGSALDAEALKRGNSVYFPDRVVPMLPEAISNELGSLKPKVNRAVMACRMRVGADGAIHGHKFLRGLIRSAARLTYEQVQAAHDGRVDDTTGPLLETVVAPLYACWKALAAARYARAPLNLDMPELQVSLNDAGVVEAITPRDRLDSHRLIEDMMIAANVCAARELERLKQPCMYRIHDQPSREKLRNLKDYVATLGLSFSAGEVPRPALFNRLIDKAAKTPHADAVNVMVLRSQAQAVYSPDNIGHFGLALGHYAHFTSPIRRYSDLLVHRALIAGLGCGPGALTKHEAERFAEIGEAISNTERRAMAAERDAMDRYLAAYMSSHVGAVFEARITGLNRAGLFVRLAGIGAEGLLPISLLADDRYEHDERSQALVGRRTGRRYSLGTSLRVTLREATPVTGGLLFELAEGEQAEAPPRRHKAKAVKRQKGRRR
ncbi:MAG: ribonuclease R [Alphaproteobacteria bacterium]